MSSPSSLNSRTLIEASFDKRLKVYVSLNVIIILIATLVGILLIPFWLIFGTLYLKRYFENLECELTTRALKFKKGVLFQTERTIPLDKIQDLTFREGPLLRYLGLSTLKIETAGQSVQGGSDMSLTGIIDARSFREKVIEQRDILTDIHAKSDSDTATESSESSDTLKSILKVLERIEKKLEKR